MAHAESITFEEFRTRFSTEEACRAELFRFTNGFVCKRQIVLNLSLRGKMEETHKGDGIMANELACLNCGKGFTPTCHITRQKFCSSGCRVRCNNAKRYYTDTPVNECPECGTPIKQSGEAGRWRRFCGKRCRQLYHYNTNNFLKRLII